LIVFTATNKHTRDVYVGTARESVEEEWADLHAQAEQGASGQFFIQLREHGADGFEVDTWAYGESPSEARESVREAREDLGAQPIKSSRSKVIARKPASEQSDSMKALMAAFQEALTDTDEVDEEDALEGLVPEASSTEKKPAGQEPVAGTDRERPLQQKPAAASPATQPEPKAEARSSVATNAEVADDSSESQDDDAKMMARIEAMKMAQAKLLQDREQSPSSAALNRVKPVASKPAKPAKIASGRTGSAAKEKRIREAIELERERRESTRQVRGRDEYDEMNAVMARVEMRRLATKRSNAEKTKQEAAQKRKLEREKKAAAATSSADSRGVQSSQAAAKSPRPTRSRAKSAVSATATEPKPKAASKTLKLAAGRTGSSAKEKRIKEAIAQEKADRLAKKSSQSATEAAEMAALLARLDERSKKAEKMKRSR